LISGILGKLNHHELDKLAAGRDNGNITDCQSAQADEQAEKHTTESKMVKRYFYKNGSVQLILLVLLSVLYANGGWGQAQGRDQVEKLSFLLPAGWKRVPSTTGPGYAIQSPKTHAVSTLQKFDYFFVRFAQQDSHSLEETKAYMEKMLRSDAKRVGEEFKRRFVPANSPLKAEVEKIHLNVKKTSISKVPAYEFSAKSLLLVQDAPVLMETRTIIVVYQNKFYVISAGYEANRRKQVKPIADAFLASLRFEK
jgi:hypothetical protein